MTPILQSTEGLTIDTGEVTVNHPALTLKQKVNDHGESEFSLLRLETEITTEDENNALIRGFSGGVQVFAVQGGTVIGQSAVFTGSVSAGSSSIQPTGLNLAAKVFLVPEFTGVLAQKNGQQPQTFRLYNTQNLETSSAENLALSWVSNQVRIQTEKTGSGLYRDMILGSGGVTLITLGSSGGIGFFGATPAARPVHGSAIAGVSYTANEQSMLNKVYSALRTLGLAS